MRYGFISLALFAFAAGLVATVAEFAAARRINVIVLTVESTRLDAIGPETTPMLWRTARQGTRFTRHRATSAWTGANIVSILTGLSPFRHGIHGRDASIPAAWITPLERLAARGWRIGGLQPFMLTEGFHNLGLAVTPGENLFGWLAQRARGGDPFFLWYHYLDTHLPYEAAPGLPQPSGPAATARAALVRTKPVIPRDLVRFEAGDQSWLKPLYYNQFSVFDRWFGDFWRFVKASGLRERTIIVLTTDHGEELLERGLVGHASTTRAGHLYDEVTPIPLIVWLPPSLRSGPQPAIIEAPSSHIDIMPTLFARLGLKAPPSLEGGDLFNLPKRRAWQAVTSRAGFAERDPARIERFAAARIEGDWKLHIDFFRPATVTRTALYMARARTAFSVRPNDRRSSPNSPLAHAMPPKSALWPKPIGGATPPSPATKSLAVTDHWEFSAPANITRAMANARAESGAWRNDESGRAEPRFGRATPSLRSYPPAP